MSKKILSKSFQETIISLLHKRFESNMQRHKKVAWKAVEEKIRANDQALFALTEMETSKGEPDVIDYDTKTKTYLFIDCSKESPESRRSLCYDDEALHSRKTHKP